MLTGESLQSGRAPIGRDAEDAQVAAVVAWLASGRGAVLEVAGDPGTGKTRLLGRLGELVARRSIPTVRAAALRGPGKPGQLFGDLWADLPAPVPAADSDEDEVFRVVRTGLAGWAAAGAGGAVVLDDVHLADEMSTRLLARLIRTPVAGPLLLVVGHCPRRTGSVLLEALDDGARTGTVVRVELGPLAVPAVAELLAAWDAGRSAPGGPAGMNAIGAGAAGMNPDAGENAAAEPYHPYRDPDFLARIRAAADGNPRHLRILAAAGWRPELWPDSPGPDTGALLREAASMAAELDVLTPAQTAVVGAAAVLAGPFGPQDAAEVAGLELGPTLAALDELVRADVLRHAAPGVRFAFRHPLLGHVVHERAPLSALMEGHRRALELLAARGAGDADLARHAEHLVGTEAATAVPLLVRGAAAILPDAPETAVRWLRLVLDTPQGRRPGGERTALMLECGRALSAAGRFDEARALAHAVLRDGADLTGPLRLRAAAMRIAAERQLGRYDEAEAVARATLDGLPRPLAADAAELVFEYGVLHLYRGTFRVVRQLVHEVAAALARAEAAAGGGAEGRAGTGADPDQDSATPPPFDPDIAASVRVLAAFGDAYLGETAAAIPALVECARLVDSMPDATAARTPEQLAMLGCGEMFMEGYTAATRHLQRCLAIADNGGPRQMTLNVLLGLAYIDQQNGHLHRAEQLALEATRVARATGAVDGLSMSEAQQVGAMVWSRGRAESAAVVALAEHAVRIARPGNGWWSGSAAMQLAQARLVGGDPAGAVAALLEGGGGRRLRLLQPAYRPMLLAMLSTAALQAGDGELARAAAADAEEAAEVSGLTVQQAYVGRARAALQAADGEHAAAARLFEEAALAFRRAGRPVQHAWTLVAGAGSAAVVLGSEAARGWLDAAEEVARLHGAVRVEEEVAAVRERLWAGTAAAGAAAGLADGGAADAAAGGSGAVGGAAGGASGAVGAALPAPGAVPLRADIRALLTAREQEIAALVATGRRSRAIADELFLSHRTVETHLARIYRKLNVSSRTALAHLLSGADGAGAE